MTTTPQATQIPFGAVGKLPAPDSHEAPQIYLLPLWGDQKGSVCVDPMKPTDYPPSYSFTPMKPAYWTDWQATGWEDCEIGTATFRATAPNGDRYLWEARLCHDGDPAREFWGAEFIRPPVLETT